MVKKSLYVAIASCALMVCGQLVAQQQTPPPGNGEIVNMLRANLPESTIISEIQLLAGRGANYDISPSGLIELQRSGASERVLNTIVWAQTTIVPGVDVPAPRGVFYRAGGNDVKLGSFLLWAEFVPRWSSWPFYPVGPKTVAMTASPSLAQVTEPTPTLIVQGWDADSGWQLVKISRATDHREVRLKRKHAFSRDFMSDSVFEPSDLRPFTVAPESDRGFTLRPSMPLETGDYALCGQLPGGAGWLRTCYEFQVSGT